jgi:hypothetical protein
MLRWVGIFRLDLSSASSCRRAVVSSRRGNEIDDLSLFYSFWDPDAKILLGITQYCFRAGNRNSGPEFGWILIGKTSTSALRPAFGLPERRFSGFPTRIRQTSHQIQYRSLAQRPAELKGPRKLLRIRQGIFDFESDLSRKLGQTQAPNIRFHGNPTSALKLDKPKPTIAGTYKLAETRPGSPITDTVRSGMARF